MDAVMWIYVALAFVVAAIIGSVMLHTIIKSAVAAALREHAHLSPAARDQDEFKV